MSSTKHPHLRQVAGTQAEASESLWSELERNIAKGRERSWERFSAPTY